MDKTQHRLFEIDIEAKTAVCQVCGLVGVTRKSRGGWACINKNRDRANKWAASHRESLRVKGRIYRKAHPGTYEEVIQARYGITMDQYNELLQKQGGGCAICGTENNLVVDHNHMTNQVRGILCNKHNLGLGYFDDAPQLLLAAVKYLDWD